MQQNSPPTYKPSPEVQAAIEQQLLSQQKNPSSKRYRTVCIPKRSWIHRNPKLFQISAITASLLIFFSKPLYDAFIAEPLPPPKIRIPAHKR